MWRRRNWRLLTVPGKSTPWLLHGSTSFTYAKCAFFCRSVIASPRIDCVLHHSFPRYFADPDFVNVPVEGLLSKEYATKRRKLIDMKRAAEKVDAGT